MGFLIGFLTFVMLVDSLALILLVLIQLPKKEAGAGLAFGGAATDALFGAGSGNVLTKITKYSAGTFFVMAVMLSMLQSHYHQRNSAEFKKLIEQSGSPSAAMPPAAPVSPATTPTTPVSPAVTPTPATNLLPVTPQVEETNTPAAAPRPATAPATKK